MTTKHSMALAIPLVVAACGGGGGSTDIEGTLVFADRTDQEITRMINAAGGTEMFGAEGQFDQFGDTFDPDPCPAIAIDGQTATVTGGCTTADGVQIAGTLVVTNPASWDQIDFHYGDDSEYEATGLAFTQGGFTTTYDGVIQRSGDFTTWDADITVDQMGAALRSDLYYHCSNPSSPSCSLSGSGLELVGVGGAKVSGKVKAGSDAGSQTMDFTLAGVDKLTVHVANGCVAWSIEGTDRGMPCP